VTLRFLQILGLGLAILAAAASPGADEGQARLGPTTHAALPRTESELWLVPSSADRSLRATSTSSGLAAAVRLYGSGDHSGALAALRKVEAVEGLAEYAAFYKGMAQIRAGSLPEAKTTLDALVARKPEGAIGSAAILAQGEVAEAAGDHRSAVTIYQRLADDKQQVTDAVLSRLGHAALAAGDRKAAAEAYVRLYYEFPLTDAAVNAASRLPGLQDQIVRTGYKADLGRAAMLFGARRYADARSAYQELQRHVSGDDREVADLRIAASDFYLKRYAAARDVLRPDLDRASRKAEARFFYLSAIRELGQHAEYVMLTRRLVQDFPDSSWSEEALNNLGTHYIVTNQDEQAARVFGELYERFPTGARAERAAWKFGWWSYREGDFATTIRVFESAVAGFPRSDYRPSFLYWTARAHGRLGARTQAESRYRLVQTDYGNSYYGRLAEKRAPRKADLPAADRVVTASHQPAAPDGPQPPTAGRIRLLLAHGLYDDALAELRYAQRQWGTSPAIEATIAWAHHHNGELRRAITLMRRAYPQHLTAGGQELPVEIRQVIFPLIYWDLIRKHSAPRNLDPYLVAALIAQESTFEPGARSVANALGLMQIMPATGRRLAQPLGIKGFSTAMLTNPEINVRMGTLHFSRLVQQFGGTHYALASYNAGENRVIRWKAERPGVDEDEFIDDIPYPETQHYVKRILGTAEDYRMLYGRDGGRPLSAAGIGR